MNRTAAERAALAEELETMTPAPLGIAHQSVVGRTDEVSPDWLVEHYRYVIRKLEKATVNRDQAPDWSTLRITMQSSGTFTRLTATVDLL